MFNNSKKLTIAKMITTMFTCMIVTKVYPNSSSGYSCQSAIFLSSSIKLASDRNLLLCHVCMFFMCVPIVR